MVRVAVVLGLGFGDEGKGTLVDWLARRRLAEDGTPPLIVRWNGGPQAAHHVVCDDGRTHCFAQLGSASFLPGARTHLGPDMVVDVYALQAEAAALERAGVPDALARVTLDPRALLVTPWHAIVGRMREARRGGARHGSTGRGVAEARLAAEAGGPALRAGSLIDGRGFVAATRRLRAALARETEALDGPPELRARMRDDDLYQAFIDAAHRLLPSGAALAPVAPEADAAILEGAQGALLDRDHGFFPHVTPSRITRAAATRACAAMGLPAPDEVWGVLRAYHTRHGAGPFPPDDPALARQLPEPHNAEGHAGRFRVGWLDGVLARLALRVAGPVDRLALTCVDRLASLPRRAVIDAWETPTGRVVAEDLVAHAPPERTRLAFAATPVVRELDASASTVAAAEALFGCAVSLVSTGPTASGKRLQPEIQ